MDFDMGDIQEVDMEGSQSFAFKSIKADEA